MKQHAGVCSGGDIFHTAVTVARKLEAKNLEFLRGWWVRAWEGVDPAAGVAVGGPGGVPAVGGLVEVLVDGVDGGWATADVRTPGWERREDDVAVVHDGISGEVVVGDRSEGGVIKARNRIERDRCKRTDRSGEVNGPSEGRHC